MKESTRYIIPPDLLEWVRVEASRRRTSMSQVIRALILDEIERREKSSGP